MTNTLLRLSALCLLLLPSACSTTGDGSPHRQASLRIQHVAYVVQPLDSLVVDAPGKAASTLAVDSAGSVSLPGGKTLAVQGKTAEEVRALVGKEWKGARVVRVDQFHGDRISVLGEVQRPSNIPIAETPMTVMDSIAATGGFTTLADTEKVSVLRQNGEEVRIYTINAAQILHGKNVEQNIFLQSGDIVTVPRSFL